MSGRTAVWCESVSVNLRLASQKRPMAVGKDLKDFQGEGAGSGADPARAFLLRKGRNTIASLTKSNTSKKFLNTVIESFTKSLKDTQQSRITQLPESSVALRREVGTVVLV